METQNDKELAEVLIAISVVARRLADKLLRSEASPLVGEGGNEDGKPRSEN